jgi:hypothetical protein
MVIFLQNKIINRKKLVRITILITFFIGILFNIDIFNYASNLTNQEYYNRELGSLKISNTDEFLFEGIQQPLNITEYGIFNNLSQEISLSNQDEINLTYFIDENHDWQVSKIENSITDIQDTRNWVNNSDFLPITVYRVYENHYSAHPYLNNRGRSQTLDSIIGPSGAIAMRVHFTNLTFEDGWDYFFMENENNTIYYVDTGAKLDFYSPWISGNILYLYYESDGTITDWGFDIDYYEFVNESSNYYINSNLWGFNNISSTNTAYGAGQANGVDSMFIALNCELSPNGDQYDATYYDGDFVELYQNISIPRGYVIDGSISFDYYAEFAMDSNENFIYCELNNKKIYSKGLADIVEAGRNTWHHTGKIYKDLWINTSNIFDNIQYEQDFNISIGIMSGSSITYSGFDDRFQQVFWIDNITLVLTTLANSSQNDIQLTINQYNLNTGTQWGEAHLNITKNQDTNPIIQTVNTISPSLTFNLDTKLYGYRKTYSKIGQSVTSGVTYKILENGSIFWEFSHNFYMPSHYEDFEFIIDKPSKWKFISVLDPTFQTIIFEGGDYGNDFLKINKTFALYPGWWTFTAISPNFLNISNTKMLKEGQWVHSSFKTGETTRIKTQVNYSDEIPLNVETTEVNLTIYFSNGTIWYQETLNPYSNGTAIFSEITFTALNSIGGNYNYSIIWTNGTALGGLESSFILNHNSSLTLLKPDDAKLDLRTAGFVGDIIPVRIVLKDSENNLTISNSIISYNWTDGTRYFTEAALGIYEIVLDTADLASRGLYSILIESSKTGFFEANLTLEINLGEETNLQILDSDYNIELHANSTIKFNFTDYDGDGIDGALVNVSITNTSLYTIDSLGNGIYDIEFSTQYIESVGIYQLDFSFTATNYEPQYYTYQFQIIEQSVNISINFDNTPINENSLQVVTFYDEINISARIMSIIDIEYVTGGVITWISDNFEKNLTEYLDFWHNTSIIFNPNNFTFGINYVYLEYQHPNYKTQTFGFQLLVNQIEFEIDLVNFEDSVRVGKGGTLSLEIELLDNETSTHIENASVSYNWQYGVGALTEISPGIYQLILKMPKNLQGNFNFKIIVSKEGTVYKATEFSFLLTIGEPSIPSFLIWLILIGATAIISVLGILSLRSYVILPRKRKKLSELLSRTQRYKDLRNIQAIVVIHKLSGIPLYSKSYSILEKQKKELFSGFIHAITTIGEEIAGKQREDHESSELQIIEKIIELDFKYFNCLICDKGDIRIVLVLKVKASERLKEIIINFSMGLTLQLSDKIENWDGSLDMFGNLIPPIVNNYIELYYKEPFEINAPEDIAKIKKEMELNSMETRILNVIYSMVKSKKNFYLEHILDAVHEQNKDKIIDAFESLIVRKLIIPSKK